jgi:hypothetical protein
MTTAEESEGSQPALEALAERFRTACESAVNPLEIASALEFEGVSDRAARDGYDVPDVFALARLLYARVPRKPPAPAAGPGPEAVPASRPLLRGLQHGLLYALPAACFPAAGPLLAGPGALAALIIALLCGWGLSQGLASVGFQRLGAGSAEQARRVLRTGLAGGLALVTLVMAVTMLTAGARLAVIAFGAGECAYMLGACVLLVLGEERWLPAALAPGVTGAGLFTLLGRPHALGPQTWAALAVTPLIACVIAVARTASPRSAGGCLPSRGELLGALPGAGLGVIAAGLLTFPLAAGNGGAFIASVPLALSMGAAEWNLLWYRRGTRQLLGQTDDPGWFRRRAGRLLLWTVTRQAAGMTVTVGAALAVAVLFARVPADQAVLLALGSYLLLGAALFLVLLMQTVQVWLVPLALAAAALCAEIALRRYGLTAQVSASAALLVTVAGYAYGRLGEAVLHA